MAKDLDPKCKQCRRASEKLFLKGERCSSAKCSFVKRNYPPGLHGVKRRKMLSNYGLQLQEKQKAKRSYGIFEKQFYNYFKKAAKKQGNVSDNLLELLEKRLDNVVYRLGFATSRTQARQFINHSLFTVNGKKVNIASYQVKSKDIIAIKSNKQELKVFSNLNKSMQEQETPQWLAIDAKELNGKVLKNPTSQDAKPNFNPTLIVEFYSR